MIEVIEWGRLPAETSYDVTCRHCSSRLRFKRSDAQSVPDQRDGDYLLIKCPVCSSDVTKTA